MFVRSRHARHLFALAVASSVVGVTACGRDFDALFDDAGTAGGGSSTTGDAGAAVDGALPPDCPTALADGGCIDTQCQGDTCSIDCAACGCDCGKLDCPSGADRCSSRCAPRTTCDVDCEAEEQCHFVCDACDGKFTCDDGAHRCDTTCTSGSSCVVDCEASESCKTTCESGASCLMTCTKVSGDKCVLDCAAPAQIESCGNGVFACNRACP